MGKLTIVDSEDIMETDNESAADDTKVLLTDIEAMINRNKGMSEGNNVENGDFQYTDEDSAAESTNSLLSDNKSFKSQTLKNREGMKNTKDNSKRTVKGRNHRSMVDKNKDKEQFRKTFNAKNFKGIDPKNSSKKYGKVITSARYDLILGFKEEVTKDPKQLSKWQHRKLFGNAYRIRDNYSITNGSLYYSDDTAKTAVMKKDRKVAKMNEVFDIIYEKHYGTLCHRGYSSVWNNLKETWWNISENDCKTFQSLCKYCQLNQPQQKPHKGSVKPIRTFSYRDRYQIDLIDFAKRACYDFPDDIEFRIKYKYVLVLRDHFSRFLILRPLQAKAARLVAIELANIFSVIGFPLILQTDNGGEFIGEEVVRELNLLAPYAHTVRGRARTPRDQGSVEVANKTIKAMITKAVPAMKDEGILDANWVMALPRVTTGCNSGRNKGKNEVSAYEAVFGMAYDHPIISANAVKFHVGETIEERVQRVGGSYADKMNTLNELIDYSDEEDKSHLACEDNSFGNRELALDVPEFNDEAKELISKREGSFFSINNSKSNYAELTLCQPVSDMDKHNLAVLEKNTVDRKQYSTVEGTSTLTEDYIMSIVMGRGEPITPQLICDKCDKSGQILTTLFPIAWLYKNYVIDKTAWFGWQFVMAYSLLLKHTFENTLEELEIVLLEPHDSRVQINEMIDLDGKIKQCASLVYREEKQHFAVVLFKLEQSHIEIYDGLYDEPEIWINPAIQLLQKIKHPLANEDPTFLKPDMNETEQLTMLDKSILSISRKNEIIQTDGYNCGPIACAVLHDLVISDQEKLKPSVNTQAQRFQSISCEGHFLRRVVVEDYGSMIHEVKHSFTILTKQQESLVQMTEANTAILSPDSDEERNVLNHKNSKEENTKPMNDSVHDSIPIGSNNDSSAQITETNTDTILSDDYKPKQYLDYDISSANLAQHMEQRGTKRQATNLSLIKRQKTLADKNIKRHYKASRKFEVKIGDYVRIKVDSRDRYQSNPLSVGGIVLQIVPDIFSIMLIVPQGILNKYVPACDYSTVSDGVVEMTEFIDLRNRVLSSEIKETDIDKLSIREIHKQQVMVTLNEEDIRARLKMAGEREELKKKKKQGGCKCKDGKCTFRCGCLRKRVNCTINCSCNGTCSQ